MSLKKKCFVIFGFLLVWVSALQAGDTASFVDMGFSRDGRVYMFAQYGVLSPSLRPWAELFILDVARNEYVSGGRVYYTHERPIVAGQDGSGALFRLLAENAALVNHHEIILPNQGQPLFISLDPTPPAGGETIEFRDFATGAFYRASLVPTIVGSGPSLRSSFLINIDIYSPGGHVQRRTIGSPHVSRDQIFSYNFRKVLVNTQGNALIFVIETRRQAATGHDVRYLVETLLL